MVFRPAGASVNSQGGRLCGTPGIPNPNPRSANGAIVTVAPLGLGPNLPPTRGSAKPPPLAIDGRPYGAEDLRHPLPRPFVTRPRIHLPPPAPPGYPDAIDRCSPVRA